MLDDLLGSNRAGRDGSGARGSLNLDQLLGSAGGGLATGAAAGGLAALLLGGAKPKKLAKNALKLGGVALVGGLAYKAWRDWQSTKSAPAVSTPDAPPAAFIPVIADERRSRARLLMRAMIAAAKADGHITDAERTRILDELETLGVDASAQAFIKDELERPIDLDAIVRDAHTPEIGAEIYAASLLAIDPAGEAERAYLGLLAARLRLDRALVRHLHETVEDAPIRDAA
ncbi:MAG TPA: tellurite resistance TerB family protein [Parvularculaceae bacterium]|nr:tellurite resistance TerB family protein [Parvularculaceae bacterium]